MNTPNPFYRLTGVVLLCKLKYTNLRTLDLHESTRADVTVEAVEGAWGYASNSMQWIDYPNLQLREDFASVQIKFLTEGSLGHFDYFTLILQIMAAAFLLRVAESIVDFVGMYLIGDRVAFAAAKYGTLELNRQRTGHRHTADSRRRLSIELARQASVESSLDSMAVCNPEGTILTSKHSQPTHTSSAVNVMLHVDTRRADSLVAPRSSPISGVAGESAPLLADSPTSPAGQITSPPTVLGHLTQDHRVSSLPGRVGTPSSPPHVAPVLPDEELSTASATL